MVGGLKSMPCEEQLKARIGQHGHGFMTTVLTSLTACHIEEEIKQWYSKYGPWSSGKLYMASFYLNEDTLVPWIKIRESWD